MEGNEKTLLQVLEAETKEKEFKAGKNKVVLRTLKQEEMSEVASKSVRGNIVATGEIEKPMTLSYSLVSINGIPITSFPDVNKLMKEKKLEIRDAIFEVVKTMDQNTIDSLYAKYLKLVDEDRKEKEKVSDFF